MRDQEKKGRGRPRGFDEPAVLDGLTETFWRKGFIDASLDDLSKSTGAARASLYKFYGDKTDLLVAALDHYAARFDSRVAAALNGADDMAVTLRNVMRASADRLTDPSAPPGCLRCRATLELVGLDPRTDAAIARINKAFALNMARILTLNLSLDQPPRDIAEKAAFLTTIVNGMVVSAQAGADRATLYAVVDRAVASVSTP